VLTWENKKESFSSDFKEICDGIEAVGSDFFVDYLNINKLNGYYWIRNFKVWEYPKVVLYLEEVQKKENKKIKVMDFGCGVTPLDQYLSQLGYDVWGVDWKFGGHLKRPTINMLQESYPDVNYYIGDINKLEISDFDVVFSCSVLEHIHPHRVLMPI
jgi:2-polyprenyl-3-methyl-5-hydroxy-6-metoxy-1,4-benzoquinol methylase